jgi:hypothetical protein
VALDPSGHNATATVAISVDRTKPVIDVVENGVPFVVPVVNRAVALFVRVNDLDRNASVTVTLNDAPYVSGTAIAVDGAYELKATAADCAGNAADEKVVHFVIDRTPPTITSVTPVNGTTIANKPPITGVVSEPAIVFVEGTNQPATVTGTTFSLAYDLKEGTNAFVLVASACAPPRRRSRSWRTARPSRPTPSIGGR